MSFSFQMSELLAKISGPQDLKNLSISELEQICSDLRDFIIQDVSQNGGHFAGSLGVVELSVALHFVFNSPQDKIARDVGHQSYPHKILTGRFSNFSTKRKLNGISGFTDPHENPHDATIAGHAGVSISNILGISVANQLQNQSEKNSIAVIGDGAMTEGVAFEALNNAGFLNSDLLVIYNDNQTSIDENIGALNSYFQKITAETEFLSAEKLSQTIPNSFCESFNFQYFGPVDGHNLPNLIQILQKLQKINGPKFLHIVTKKGKGYPFAENEPTKRHASNGFDIAAGKSTQKIPESGTKPQKRQDTFSETMIELAEQDEKIVAVTPAMLSGSGLDKVKKIYPDRVFDVGICEQHAVSFAAGLATQGQTVFCHLYSTFSQRAYDQIVHDVCIPNLPVIFCLDRAGFVGEDGATHQGAYDIAFLRCIPNLKIFAPMDESELRNILFTASQSLDGPIAIRYPKTSVKNPNQKQPFQKIPIGKLRKLKSGTETAILTIGFAGNLVSQALSQLETSEKYSHYDMRFVKPLDSELLHEIMQNHQKLILVEDHAKMGGFSSVILERMADHNYSLPVQRIGIPDKFIEHAKISEQQAICGYGVEELKAQFILDHQRNLQM